MEYKGQTYHFDKNIYANRVFDSHGVADPSVEIQMGPNIKDWPKMVALTDNLILKVVSEIHDPVTIILMVFTIVFSMVLSGLSATAFLQGILCWGVSVGINQTAKQLSKQE